MPKPLGAAQPIMDGIQQVGQGIMHPIDTFRNMMQPAPAPPDTSWHDSKVKEANQSFQMPQHELPDTRKKR